MIINCITHAAARDKKKHPFRGLTEQGWREVNGAAEQFRKLIDEETPAIETIISSPKARCVETAILFAKAISVRPSGSCSLAASRALRAIRSIAWQTAR